jgi:hypothetical protein
MTQNRNRVGGIVLQAGLQKHVLANGYLVRVWLFGGNSANNQANPAKPNNTTPTPAGGVAHEIEGQLEDVIDYKSKQIEKVYISEQEIFGKQKLVLCISQPLGHELFLGEHKQTIDLIERAKGKAIFVKVGRKSEIKMICFVSDDHIIVDKVLDSHGKEIGINEIKSKFQGEWSAGISKISTKSIVNEAASPAPVSAENGNVPSSTSTGPKPEHVAGNGPAPAARHGSI